jgi:hypothetical protein
MIKFRPLTLKLEFLKIPVSLQTVFEVETCLAVGKWLEEQVNMLKLRMLRLGTRRPTISRTYGQHLVPIKTFIKNKVSKWRRLLCSVNKFNLCNELSYWYSIR